MTAFPRRLGRSPKANTVVESFNLRYGAAEDGPNRWERRRGLVIECLRQYPFDVMGTQEGLPAQLEEIKAALPHLDYLGVGRYSGVETDRTHERNGGEHCAIFYDKRKWQVRQEGTFWLSDTPEQPGSATWGNDLPRIVTWGLFGAREEPTQMAVFNTHFHWGEPVVRNSTRLLLDSLAEIAVGSPTIVMGDFNQEPDGSTHQALTKTAGLVDCWRACGHGEEEAGTYHGFSGKGQGRIDWLLVSKHFDPLRAERVTFHQGGQYPSDHFPVRATLRLRDSG